MFSRGLKKTVGQRIYSEKESHTAQYFPHLIGGVKIWTFQNKNPEMCPICFQEISHYMLNSDLRLGIFVTVHLFFLEVKEG